MIGNDWYLVFENVHCKKKESILLMPNNPIRCLRKTTVYDIMYLYKHI